MRVQRRANLNGSVRGNLRFAVDIEVEYFVRVVVHIVQVVVALRTVTSWALLFAFIIHLQAEPSIKVLCRRRPRGHEKAGAILRISSQQRRGAKTRWKPWNRDRASIGVFKLLHAIQNSKSCSKCAMGVFGEQLLGRIAVHSIWRCGSPSYRCKLSRKCWRMSISCGSLLSSRCRANKEGSNHLHNKCSG